MVFRVISRCLLALSGVVWGQSRPAPSSPHTSVQHKRQPAVSSHTGATATDDAALEARIRERLARSKLGTDPVRVTVRGGVATFEGETSVIQRKGSATRMARSAGAVRVENRIRLSDEAKRKAAENLSKGRRRAQVVRGLRRDQR